MESLELRAYKEGSCALIIIQCALQGFSINIKQLTREEENGFCTTPAACMILSEEFGHGSTLSDNVAETEPDLECCKIGSLFETDPMQSVEVVMVSGALPPLLVCTLWRGGSVVGVLVTTLWYVVGVQYQLGT